MAKHGGHKGTKPGKAAPQGRLNYSPNYQTLLQNDPAFMALKQQISAQQTQDQAARNAAINQALIQFGAIPNFSSLGSSMGLSAADIAALQSAIDPHSAALAQQNTAAGLSTEAQLQHQQQNAIRSLRNNLAARGALSSGEDAYQTNEQNLSYAQAQNRALQSLLSSLGGYQQTYLTNQQNEQNQLTSGIQSAEQNQMALPQNSGFSLQYNPRTGKYHSSSGGSFSVGHHGGNMFVTSDQTGTSYLVGANGALTAQ